jgi:predicted ATP-binding protein involved in virulence
MKIRKLYIRDCKIFQNTDLDFTHNDEPQNFVVIAGINGSGKTTLLNDVIYRTFQNMAKTAHFYPDGMPDDVFIELEYKGKDSIRIFQTDTDKVFPEDISFLYPKLKNVIFYEAGIPDTKTAKESIIRFVDTLIYEKDKKSSEAYSATQEILNSLFQDFDLQIEFKGLDRHRDVLFRNSAAEKIKIENLSGGEQEIITKAFSLYLADIRDSIILIDEPESSLHPNWQNRIAPIYQKFADKNNNQVILATHSPHIVSAVPKEQIRILAKDGNTIKLLKDFAGSYGRRADEVLLEIFGLEGLRTPSAEEKLHQLRRKVFADQYETAEFKQLLNEMEKRIGYGDRDLSLIRMEVARRMAENEKNKQN